MYLDQASSEIKEKVLEGRIKVDRAYKDLKNQHWLTKQISDNKKFDLAFEKAIDKITLYVGDFKKVIFDKMQADSVSLIFTDPLYHEDKLYLYKRAFKDR